MKKFCLTVGIIIVAIAIAFVGVSIVQAKTYKVQNPVATIEVEGYDSPIKIEMDPQSAPNAVANFIKLANSGYYNDFTMKIDESGILGDESMQMAKLSQIVNEPEKDYVYGIKGDFIANGVDNLIKHKKGTITMERNDYSYFGYTEEGYNSANCNFRILTKDADNYNGYYASFGNVVEGLDVLEKIAESRVEEKTEDTSSSKDSTEEEDSKNKIKIKSISVETYGVDYGVPEYVNYEENIEKVNQAYSKYFGGSSGTVTTEN